MSISIGHESPSERADRVAAEFHVRSGDLAIDMAKPRPSALDRLLDSPSPLDRLTDGAQGLPAALARGETTAVRAHAAMTDGESRGLRPGEAAAVQRVFGESVDPARLRIVAGPGDSFIAAQAFRNGNPAITIGDTIYFRNAPTDLSTSADGLRTLAHEVNHVRQYQTYGTAGVFARIAGDALGHGQNGAYAYYERDRAFTNETLEGQSQIVGDYARYRETGVLPTYNVDGRQVTIGAQRLEQWAAGSGAYGR